MTYEIIFCLFWSWCANKQLLFNLAQPYIAISIFGKPVAPFLSTYKVSGWIEKLIEG